jgi:hypothetical protein
MRLSFEVGFESQAEHYRKEFLFCAGLLAQEIGKPAVAERTDLRFAYRSKGRWRKRGSCVRVGFSRFRAEPSHPCLLTFDDQASRGPDGNHSARCAKSMMMIPKRITLSVSGIRADSALSCVVWKR